MADERKVSKHTITMEKRENVFITGILDVLSFDEEDVVIECELGVLVIKGKELHVNKLNLDSGELQIDGNINSLEYEEDSALSKNKPSFISRIFK